MNISDLIEEHKQNSQKLVEAIENNNFDLVEQLDKIVLNKFQSILDCNISTSEALIEKIDFLLEELLGDDQNSPLATTISKQITKDVTSFLA
jgi:hypothetical protein